MLKPGEQIECPMCGEFHLVEKLPGVSTPFVACPKAPKLSVTMLDKDHVDGLRRLAPVPCGATLQRPMLGVYPCVKYRGHDGEHLFTGDQLN